ncbi:MAG TPA: PIN domain-containing protein [Candidatus Paceibacterota bacterium]
MADVNDGEGLISTVFVDSDAFVAFVKGDDSNHARAVKIFEKLKTQHVKFLTSNYVFAETVTVISQQVGREQAFSFIRAVKNIEAPFPYRWVDSDIEELALEIFGSQTSKNVSFVDCTNIAIIRKDALDAIFSFDAVYRKNGIRYGEELVAHKLGN